MKKQKDKVPFVGGVIILFGLGFCFGLFCASANGAWITQETADEICVSLYGDNTIYKDSGIKVGTEFVCTNKVPKPIIENKETIRLE